MNRLKIEDGKLYFYCEDMSVWEEVRELFTLNEVDVFAYELKDNQVFIGSFLILSINNIKPYIFSNITKQEKITLLEYLKLKVENEK